MVLWCKICGALLGLRPPLENWATDREGVCVECMKKPGIDVPVPPPNSVSDAADKSNDRDA